jgi:hypothetical protein
MKKEQVQTKEDDIKPDLKHDTMEFSAATDGDDALDTDDVTYEEEGITGEELDAIDDDDDKEAAALNAEETDHLADEDTLPEEDWTEDADLDDNAEDS